MEIKVVVEDGEFDHFNDMVVASSANQLTNAVKKEIESLVRERIFDTINESVGSILAGVIENPIQKTNQWGEPVGGTMSLREVILQEGINWFSQPVDSSGKAANNCSQGMPRAQQMAVKVINDAISKDINSQIQEAVVVIKSQIDGKIKLAVESAFKNIIGVK